MSHNNFKVFKGKAKGLSLLRKKIETFVDTKKISARSIGIEFIEHTQEVIISLGYSEKGKYAPVAITSVNLGVVDLSDTAEMEKLMTAAATKQKKVICHELCVTDKNELILLFMSTK